jgi:Fe-S cluster assembly protein SufD
MTQLVEDLNMHQENADRFEQQSAADGATWLRDLRAAALARFADLGFPNRKQEEWRFTNVDAIAKTEYQLPPATHDRGQLSAAAAFGFATDAAVELFFVNGHYAPSISRIDGLPRGVKVSRLVEAAATEPAVRTHLARHASITNNPFVAYNTGFVRDGLFVHVSKGVTLEKPIHVIFYNTGGGLTVTHPRVLVVADENAEASVVETYAGDGSAAAPARYLTNAVVEFVVAQDARIDHCKVQQESTSASHISTTQAQLGTAARFVSHSTTIGGLLTRNEVNVILAGERADATINGLVLLDGNRHCDNHTLLDHAAAHCPSHELYKHVLSGKSTGVFKGKILVRPDSQKTDSKQTSKTLLLSDDALMNSMPALEIYADDVKCTHGSTTGPMDEEQIFYLRSRGVSAESARHLMTYAFAADITRRIRVEPVRARIENHMAAKYGLPLDLRITQLGAYDDAVVNV